MIIEVENVNITERGIEAVIKTSEGDLRKAITTLQSCYRYIQKIKSRIYKYKIPNVRN